ncbi:MAG: hypothetical protein AMXMBFR64_33970 [Myxococcales bacterium]
MTEVTILTLPFDPLLDGFPSERIRDYLHGREVVHLSTFPFVHEGRPYWSLCLSTRRHVDAPAADSAAPDDAAPVPEAVRKALAKELLSGLGEHERALYDRLRGWRRDVAAVTGLARFMVASDALLIELVRRRPTTKAGLADIKGLGEKKIAEYGDALLEVLHGAARPGPAGRPVPAHRAPVDGPHDVAAGDDPALPPPLEAQPGEPHRRRGAPGADPAERGDVQEAQGGDPA